VEKHPVTGAQSSGTNATPSFDTFAFHPQIKAAIDSARYTQPTPIQAKAIPQVLAGHDLMGLAQTGTGKTAAFVLPILQRFVTDKRPGARALVLAPTRELAEQIHTVVVQFAERLSIKSCVVYGGVSMGPQMENLRRGAQIIVACPGRLLDHIARRTVDLRNLEVLVLDEADQMFDMGFLPSIRQILSRLPKERQTLLFSATMPSEIRKLAQEILHDPVTVQIAHNAPSGTVAHGVFHVDKQRKSPLLVELIHRAGEDSVLVFTRTKHQAKRLGKQLSENGIRAASLQGNLSQNKRQQAMDGFRNGRHQVLVATDIAARGIDVSAVKLVINYDIPGTPEAYTHRIGRTGRALASGEAFTFVSADEMSQLRFIEKTIGKKIERRDLEGFHLKPLVSAPKESANGHKANRQGANGQGANGSGSNGSRSRPHHPRSGGRSQGRRSGQSSSRPRHSAGDPDNNNSADGNTVQGHSGHSLLEQNHYRPNGNARRNPRRNFRSGARREQASDRRSFA